MYKHLSGRLEDLIAIGDTPVHLWAACQICDMKSLDGLTGFASLNAPEARVATGQTRDGRLCAVVGLPSPLVCCHRF